MYRKLEQGRIKDSNTSYKWNLEKVQQKKKDCTYSSMVGSVGTMEFIAVMTSIHVVRYNGPYNLFWFEEL